MRKLLAPLVLLLASTLPAHAQTPAPPVEGVAILKDFAFTTGEKLPELMPVLIAAAKARGLRVSGHVPAGMTMEEVVVAGYDEVQHANFWVLNFLGPEVAARTNSPVRFTAVGEQGAALDLDSPAVIAFVALLRERGTTLDPTMAAMEDALTGRRRGAWHGSRPHQGIGRRLAGAGWLVRLSSPLSWLCAAQLLGEPEFLCRQLVNLRLCGTISRLWLVALL